MIQLFKEALVGHGRAPGAALRAARAAIGAAGCAGATDLSVGDHKAGKPAAAAVALCLFQHDDLLAGELCQLHRRHGAPSPCADDHAVGLQLLGSVGHDHLGLAGVNGADVADLHALAAFHAFVQVDLVLGAHIVDGVGGTFQRTVVTAQTEGFDLVSHMLSSFLSLGAATQTHFCGAAPIFYNLSWVDSGPV